MSTRYAFSMKTKRRAIGIIRVSQTRGREGERFASPEEQRERIEAVCERDGLELITVHEELDVSGGKSLAKRPGLGAAVAAIEAGEADVVAAAYFDRLFRSLQTQAEVVERVEQAGGQVLAVDVGQVTNDSAGQWLSGTMMGAVSEYFRRSATERSAEGQARAVARGSFPGPSPLGYLRRDDGTLEIDAAAVPIVRSVFRMRDRGQSLEKIRAMLISRGIRRSQRGVAVMLKSRIYLGEIHFGKLVNLNAHEPIIDRELFRRVNEKKIPRGPRPSSDRLLARCNVLRCGSCNARLSVSKVSTRNGYPFYRCTTIDCEKRTSIGAVIAEQVVSDHVRNALQDAQGRASIAENAQEAARDVSRTQDALDSALRVFSLTGAENEASAVERITELRRLRDDAQARLDQIGPQASRIIGADADWDALSLDGRRALIRATVESAVVAAGGRGAERITVRLRSP